MAPLAPPSATGLIPWLTCSLSFGKSGNRLVEFVTASRSQPADSTKAAPWVTSGSSQLAESEDLYRKLYVTENKAQEIGSRQLGSFECFGDTLSLRSEWGLAGNVSRIQVPFQLRVVRRMGDVVGAEVVEGERRPAQGFAASLPTGEGVGEQKESSGSEAEDRSLAAAVALGHCDCVAEEEGDGRDGGVEPGMAGVQQGRVSPLRVGEEGKGSWEEGVATEQTKEPETVLFPISLQAGAIVADTMSQGIAEGTKHLAAGIQRQGL